MYAILLFEAVRQRHILQRQKRNASAPPCSVLVACMMCESSHKTLSCFPLFTQSFFLYLQYLTRG